MSKWSDNDMDKLFQDGSEKYDFEYRPEAWEQMDTLLDQQGRRRRLLWWTCAGMAAVFVALFSFFIFMENTNPDGNSQAIQPPPTAIESPQTPDVQKDKATDQNPSISAAPTQNHQENGLGETIQQEQALPTVSGHGEEQGANFQQKSLDQSAVPDGALLPKATTTTTPPRPIAESGTQGQRDTGIAAASGTSSENLIFHDNKDEDGDLSKPGEKAAPLLVSPKRLPLLAIELLPASALPNLVLSSLEFSKIKKIVPPPQSNALLVGLAGATEFNSVGFGDFSEMNWKFGIQLEYRFAKRLAVKSGVNYIHMWYDAGKGEYIPPKGFWTDGIAPVSTRGQCDLLEIPLQLSYHFKGHKNNGFYASAGVASYLILEEHYWYNYYNPPPDPVVYWFTETNERNWLNIGLLSAGYNQNFSEKLSLQIGPYAQFPLTGVGHGNVKIYSVGVNAVVNFKVK